MKQIDEYYCMYNFAFAIYINNLISEEQYEKIKNFLNKRYEKYLSE